MNGLDQYAIPITLICWIIGAIFIVRSIYQYKSWRAGTKEDLWHFLALLLGGVGTVWIGIGVMPLYIVAMQVIDEIFLYIPLYLVFILGVAAIWLVTIAYILKWREMKK
ncbi:MAG: hypothetical protein LUQ65_08590 [Candidatus Helarchaeota archaeon]|nr:hypothetical protein [Candidatus Helarchaeota archaeon]